MNTVRTILFVENDPVALQMYSKRLEREGFHIDSAQDGLDALKLISQLTPDLVVLDMMLPRLGGDDVLKFIRADPRLKSIPVVIFSNAPLTEMAPHAALAGPTRHLLKSDSTFPMLLQTIQELLTSEPAIPEASIPPSVANADPAPPARPAEIAGIRDETPTPCDSFLAEAVQEMPRIREHCFAYIKAPASPASLQHLPNLYQRVHFISTNAGKSGCARVAMLAKAFDALLSEIMVKPSWVTPSVLQTTAQAVDCLDLLLKKDPAELAQPLPQARVLAVDDDAVCNHVMVTTLKRANFDARSVDDPIAALQLLQTTQFDLVLLDISMPGLTGFELCEKLRRFPHCKSIPVIFITGHNNFDNRKQSVLSGGHDFITKPVSPSELALKATLHVVRNAAKSGGATRPAAKEPEINPQAAPKPAPASETTGILPASAFLPMTESGNSNPILAASPAESQGLAPNHKELEESPTLFGVDSSRDAVADSGPSSSGLERDFVSKPDTAVPRGKIDAVPQPRHTRTPSSSDAPAQSASVDLPLETLPKAGSPSHETDELLEQIAVIVARMMFGEDNVTERNLRLVRIALEHHELPRILNSTNSAVKEGHPAAARPELS